MADAPVVNVEDDDPTAPPAPAPAAVVPPVAVAPATPPPDDDEAEPDQAEGLLAALRAARAKNKDLKTQAQRAAELERENAQMRPYADLVRNNPGLLQPRAPEAPAKPTTDPAAEKAARLYDFYKADGSLDVDRGRAHLDLQREIAAQVAQDQVKPLATSMYTTASQRNLDVLANTPAANGVKPDRALLDQLWRSVDPSMTADPNLALAIHAMAAGFSKHAPAAPAPPAGPPVVTEHAGSPPKGRTVSALEKGVAANKGWSEEKMQKLSEGYVKGRTTQLED